MSVAIVKPGDSGFDPSLSVPSFRRVWPLAHPTVGGTFEVDAYDTAAGVPRVYWARTGNSQMADDNTAARRQEVGRLGGTNINANEDQFIVATGDGHIFRMVTPQQDVAAGPIVQHARMAFYRITFRLDNDAINWGNRTGFLIRMFRLGVTFWSPDSGVLVDRAGFGICGGNDGLWHFKSKISDTGAPAAFDEDLVLTWPVAIERYCTVTVVAISATATKLGKYQVFLGTTLAIERSYDNTGNSTTLPLHDNVTPAGLGLVPYVGCMGLTTPSQRLYIRDYEYNVGAVHPITKEIFDGK